MFTVYSIAPTLQTIYNVIKDTENNITNLMQAKQLSKHVQTALRKKLLNDTLHIQQTCLLLSLMHKPV